MSGKFSYSSDEENYTGEFATRELAIEEARTEGLKRFWTGENRKPDYLDGVDGDWLLERVTDTEDFYIEQASDWPNASRPQVDDLTAMLQETFSRWVAKYALEPKFWVAEKVEEHVFD